MLQPLPRRLLLELLQLRLEEATYRTVLEMLLELHLEILQYKNSAKLLSADVFIIILHLRLEICLFFCFARLNFFRYLTANHYPRVHSHLRFIRRELLSELFAK